MKAHERFLDYISFDTQSDDKSETFPSSKKQLKLGQHLADELKGLGIKDATLDENGYVYGTLPASEGSEDKPGFRSCVFLSQISAQADTMSTAGMNMSLQNPLIPARKY